MSTLIITLPVDTVVAETEFDFVVTDDGVSVAQDGRALAAALPLLDKTGDICIAMAPVRALSWHQVTVPVGVMPGSARMRAVLDGLLEDKLLDDLDLLHVVLPPTFQTGTVLWVAVCDRRWLAMVVQGLASAKRPVSRVVPEWEPSAAPLRMHVTGTVEAPQLVICGDSGVGIFPLKTDALQGLASTDSVSAEPALTALASHILQRSVISLPRAERMIQTIHSPWDLSKRLQMRNLVNRGKLEWLQAPRWRSVRWAALALLGVNLLGLNALAWVHEHQLAVKRAATQAVLMRSFPHLKIIVDAPAQMAREVRLLEQARAVPAAADLDVMLGALGQVLPAGQTLKGVEYASGQLRLTGLELTADEVRVLSAGLSGRGFSITRDGVHWLMQPVAAIVGKP